MTSLTAWERSFLYASCSQGWAQQRQVLVDLQHLSHCSCWQAPLFSRNSLGTLRYGEVRLVSAARQNPLGHGNTVFAFLLSQSLEVQGKLVWCGYVPLLSVKCLTCTSCCLKRPIWNKQMLQDWEGTSNQLPLVLPSRISVQIPVRFIFLDLLSSPSLFWRSCTLPASKYSLFCPS